MPRNWLRRADGHPFGMFPQNSFDRLGFDRIVQRRGRTVGVDVFHFGRMRPRVAQRLFQRPRVAHPVGMRLGRVPRLATVAVPGNFRINARPAPQRVRKFFQHEISRAFPKQKTIARPVKRTHRPGRTPVLLGHRSNAAKTHMQILHCRFRTSRQRHVHVVEPDHACRVANGVAAGRAPRTIRHGVTVNPQMQADGAAALPAISRHDIVGIQRPEIIIALLETVARLDDAFRPADRCSLHHPHPVPIQAAQIDPGVLDRQRCRRHTILDAQIKPSRFPALDIFRNVEILHLRRDLDRQPARVKAGDGSGRADPAAHVRPESFQIPATGRNDPHSSYHHTAFAGIDLHGYRFSHRNGTKVFDIQTCQSKLSVTKLEAVLFFTDLITIFARKTLQLRLILQMAISVIRPVLQHFQHNFNQIQQEFDGPGRKSDENLVERYVLILFLHLFKRRL